MTRRTALRSLFVLAVLCLVGLAGCSDAPKDAPVPEGPQAREVETGPDVGAISGVVVDERIVPVAGAVVTLVGRERTTEVDESGLFVFEDLEPGLYSLMASAPGYLDIQATADVQAGAVAKPKMVMPVDASEQPYHQTYQHHGFAEAYLGYVSFVLDTLQPGVQGCDCSMALTPDPDARTFVFEAFGEVWATDPTGSGSLYWELFNDDGYDPNDPTAEGFRIASGYDLDFPVNHQVQRADWNNETTTWTARLTGGVWVHPQLEYDMFLTVFYREPAPAGWSINGT